MAEYKIAFSKAWIIRIWVFIILIDCFSLYYKIIGYIPLQLANIILTCIILLTFSKKKFKIVIEKRYGYVLAYYLFTCAFLIVFSDYKYVGFITGCMIPIILYVFILSQDSTINVIELVFRSLSNLTVAVCVISLFFYFFTTVKSAIEPTTVYSANQIGWADWNYLSYFGVYFAGHKTFFFGRTILRNIGIFLEAPVFAYIIVSTLYYELFLKKEQQVLRVLILVLAAITSFSTSALVVGAILLYFYIYKRFMKKNIFILLVPIFLMLVFYFGYTVVADKLSVINNSGIVRQDDLSACIKCFLSNPIGGTGFNNVRALDPYRASNRQTGTSGVSNGIPFVFANGGLLYGLFYIMPVIIGIIKFVNRKIELNKLGFILTQSALLMVIVTEYTLLGQLMLVVSWVYALQTVEDKRHFYE